MPNEALARSFQTTGADYDLYRPGFPQAAVEAILPHSVDTVLDLGAGTGKFTENLLEVAGQVIAVEPSEQMLQVLRSKCPGVEALVGTAESVPLDDDTVQAVTVAQAFHWFDRAAACAEIARVLVPGGTLGLVWNHSDPSCEWDRACHRIAQPAVGATDDTTATSDSELPGFRLALHKKVQWTERITREHYICRWATVSSFLIADDQTRATMLSEIEAVLDTHVETAEKAELALPQVTDVYVYSAH